MATAADITGGRALPLVSETSATRVRTQRWLALDLLRFLAVVMMVQGHTFYEVIHPDVAAEYWYRWHGYVHGFTAPVFLFSSGMAFGITTLTRWQKHTVLGATVYKRIERYVMLIGLGYLLQISVLRLSWLQALPIERLDAVASINALQHIGLVLLACEVLPLLLRRRRLYVGVIVLALVVCVALGPWAWNLDTSSLNPFVAGWLNHTRGSLFPLIPWAGFILAGIGMAAFVTWRRQQAAAGLRQLFVPLAIAGIALIFVGDRLAHASWQPFPDHYFWKVNPWWFVIRLGAVTLTLSLLCALDCAFHRIQATHSGSTRLLQIIGSQTLVIYVAHLVLIYGHMGFPSLQHRFADSLQLGSATLLVMAMMIALGLLAWLWHRTKTRHPVGFERVRYAAMIGIALLFVLR